MLKVTKDSAAPVRLVRDHRRQAVVVAVALVAVVAALLVLSVSERSSSAQSEPQTVGRVTGLAASADGQPDGTVRLTWNAAENAQVYMVLFLKHDDVIAGNYANGQMRAFTATQGAISGLDGGAKYYFVARGMRFNWSDFSEALGDWSTVSSATPNGVSGEPSSTSPQSEPQTVGRVTGLQASSEGQPPGTVRLTWNAAENAQVYMVLFLKHDDVIAGNYANGQMRVFTATQGAISGLDGGAKYYFVARGMRFNWTDFSEALGDWSTVQAATPAVTLTIPFVELEYGEWLEDNKPASADRIKALPWVADGVDETEREAAEQLIRAARWYPDTFNILMEMTWVNDSVVTADEAKAILQIRWSAHYSAELSRQMSQKPWVQDGITTAEADAMWSLAWTIREAPDSAGQMLNRPWVQDGITETEAEALKFLGGIIRRNADAAAALMAMPFLESLEIRDTLALRSLNNISARDANDFGELMSIPKIKDGITDEDTKIVAVLGGHTYSRAPGSARVLLAETGVYIEERLIELPHTGETLLAVIRVEDKDTPSMDNFEHAVRTIEEFMGEPYPINYLALLFYDREDQNANNNFTHLHMMPNSDVPDDHPESRPGVIAHEAAHWYWRNDGEGYQYQKWISEGSADFLRIISEHERIGRPLDPIGRECRYFDSISELEKANPDRTFIPGQSTPRECYYSLGNRFFLDLYLALGDETFRPAYRTLYLRYRQDDPPDDCGGPPLNICRVAAAFKDGASADVVAKVDEIIDRWYYGTEPAAEIRLDFPWLDDGVTEDEQRAIRYLREILEEAPAVVKTLLGFPWLADGITNDEAWAITHLRLMLRDDPAFAETLLGFPWFADGVTNAERNAAFYLRKILRADPAAAKTLLSSPWLADGVSRNEERTLRSLRGLYETDPNSLSALNTKPWYKDGLSNEELKVVGYLASIARQSQSDAQAIIDMPFLESVEIRDTLALESLSEIAEESVSDFRELMSHPRIKDGITDEETKIVAVLGQATYKYAPGSAQVLLAETGVYIEERLIELPHTGETLLAVIRVEDKVTPRMDHFEHAVRSIERFMGVPYPIDYLALLYYEYDYFANNNFTHLLIPAELDTVDGPRFHASVIAHEAAHWYWRSGQKWVSEGSADFLRIISEHERTGRSLKPTKDPCPYFDNISELEKANPKVNPQRVCWYSLGQRFFLDLYLAVGDETFRPAFRDLYLNPTDDCDGAAPNICHVAAAFKDGASDDVAAKVDEVIARWYGPLP